MRLGVMRRPSTVLTFVPTAPRAEMKQRPSPADRSESLSSQKLPPVTFATRPIRSPTAFGVSNDATPGRLPSKKYSDSPRVKLFAGSGVKSGTLSPTDERRSAGRAASTSSRARRYHATTLRM